MSAVSCAGKGVQQRLWLVCALALTNEARSIALSPRTARYALSPTVAVALCLENAAHPAVIPTGGAKLMLVRLTCIHNMAQDLWPLRAVLLEDLVWVP